MGPTELIQVGVVATTHGYDGRLRIQSASGDPGRFRSGVFLHIAGQSFEVLHTGGTPQYPLVKLAGLDTKEDAESLAGQSVLIRADDLPEPPPDTYYHFQLIGLAVRDESGQELGTLTEIVETGANDVYVVTTTEGEAELLVPAVDEVVTRIDVEAGEMSVDIPEGLEWRPLRQSRERQRPPRRRRRFPRSRRREE